MQHQKHAQMDINAITQATKAANRAAEAAAAVENLSHL